MPEHLNPDCRDGKHHACAGDAWDNHQDEPTACACDCHEPEPVESFDDVDDWDTTSPHHEPFMRYLPGVGAVHDGTYGGAR